MNEKYIEQMGLILKNTYKIPEHSPKSIGKLIMNIVRYLEAEELRDMREEKNK